MSTTAPITRSKLATGAAFLLGLGGIAGALGSQYLGGLSPCELCLTQRLPYYWGLPILALVLVLWNRLPRAVWFLGVGIVTALFAFGSGVGVYHAGVEWKFFPGPTSCTGTGVAVNFNDLSNINAARVVPCDQVQFELFGISMAGYNALLSAAVVVLLGIAAYQRWRAAKT